MTSDHQDIVFVDEPPEAVVDAEVVAPHGVPCGACGAPVEPGDRFCTHCGATVEETPVADVVAESPPQRHIECQTCGAQITTSLDQRSYTCPFCDSTYVTENIEAASGRQPPEFVIGFAITPSDALERFRKWQRDNSIFRPGDLAMAEIEGKLRGVYLPFWRFTMRSHSRWAAEIGEHWYRTETYTTTENGKTVTRTRQVQETEWWSLAGQHHLYHRDYLVSGSKGLPQQEAQRIGPFNLPALKRYEPYYIAGWTTEEYSIDQQQANDLCRAEFERRERAAVAAFLPGDTHRDLRVSTTFSDPTSDLCLLPVYLLSYRYQDQVYRFLLNGQTGRMAGDKPWSWRRIGAAIGIGVVLLAILIIIVLIIAGVIAANG
jgi:hypothetical protein